MKPPDIVLDTNVIVAALRSKRGASNKVLSLVGTQKFEIHDSVALILELAVTAQCEYIVTHNTSDFKGIDKDGIQATIPREFLQIIREVKE